jgi:hypothetical protein
VKGWFFWKKLADFGFFQRLYFFNDQVEFLLTLGIIVIKPVELAQSDTREFGRLLFGSINVVK